MKNKHPSLLPFFILFSLVICNCDLLTGPKMDLFQQISDEVDWANAAKLTVRVEYPPAWGMSNPAQGTITPKKDIRKGYAFDIEFIPDVVWSFNGWRAYRSSSLPANWITEWAANPSLLDDLDLARLDGVSVAVPDLPARGGTGSLTINTTENITLVPWCKSEPYVTRTIPRDSPAASYPRGTDIVIYFNTPLKLDEGKALDTLFTAGTISITGDGDDFTGMYNPPVYAANDDGTYTITISPSDVPGGKLIVVSVGPGIANTLGTLMSKAEVFSFRTQSSSSGGSITSWNASYTGNTITVGWEISKVNESDVVEVKARYRVNQGGDNNLANDKTIRGVNGPDASGVTEGRSVNGIREYEIFLDLYIEGVKSNTASTSFKIWNFPGMVSVSNTNPVIEIGEAADFNRIRTSGLGGANKDKKYVLVKDVEISGVWTPIGSGSDASAFQGTFYGAGRTITLEKGFSSGANYAGIFGYAQNALIRDLTVVYHNTKHEADISGAFYTVGGIAGTAVGSTKILNCMVKGESETAVLEAKNTGGAVYLGGIAGRVIDTSYIQNCYAALNVTISYARGNYGVGAKNLGGVVGHYKTSGTLENVKSVAVLNLSGDGEGGARNCGGIAGMVEGANMRGCTFSGKIDIPLLPGTSSDASFYYIGGLVGRYTVDSLGTEDITIESCETSGDLIVQCSVPINSFYMGGMFGALGSSANNNSSVKCKLSLKKLTFKDGIISLNSPTGGGNMYVGGFAGSVGIFVDVNDCHSNARSVTASSTNKSLYIGGFAGEITKGYMVKDGKDWVKISDCSSSSPVIVPSQNSATNTLRAGGFCGALIDMRDTNLGYIPSKLERCYATGKVDVYSGGISRVGGLVGSSEITGTTTTDTIANDTTANTIIQCYATGDVTVVSRYSTALLDVFAGGLAGIAAGVNISESYAVGNVNVRKGTGAGGIAAGGLVGYLGPPVNTSSAYNNNKSSITNCYATGDVTADNPNADAAAVYSGGLVGYVNIDTTKAVTRSLAVGTVSAKNASSGAGAWAGGIVGKKESGQLLQCAAPGRSDKLVSVSARGGNNRHVGKVYGESAGTTDRVYASNILYFGVGSGYYDNPVLGTSGVGVGNGGNGANLVELMWNNSTYLGFDTNVWNFGPLLRGWPVLNHTGGDQ